MPAEPVPLRDILHGRRGAFLLALLLAEFGAAMQGIAYSTVLPIVAADLDGFALFGATLAAGSVAAVLMLSATAPLLARVPPGGVLLAATVLYVAGVAITVAAPAMAWVLAGTVVRGIAAGLLAGFGMGALGALFDDRERPRVFGLFALVWLLPSVVGPAVNAGITAAIGWRWALAWPAVVVLVARAFMGRFVSAVPWERRTVALRPLVGIAVAAALGLAAGGSVLPGAVGAALFAVGAVGAAAGIVVFLWRGAPPGARLPLLAFAALCAAFFGVYELLAVTTLEAAGGTLLWAAVALTGGLLAWSIAGLRPRPDARPDRPLLGSVLVAISAGVVVVALAGSPGPFALGCIVTAAVLAGTGMGWAYPILSSEPFTSGAAASTTGTLIAFAETAATAWAVLVAGGLFSRLEAAGAPAARALLVCFAGLVVVGALVVVVSALRLRARSVGGSAGDVDAESARE